MAFSGAGVGTLVSPYEITTLTQLNEIRDDLSAYYRLMNNIDATDTTNWNLGAGWIPAGTFAGTLDGNYNKIIGLYINSTSALSGLFVNLGVCTIKNLGMEDVNINGTSHVGAFAGRTSGICLVENTYVSGQISSTSSNIGGFVGQPMGFASLFKNCYVKAVINNATSYAGGFSGWSGSNKLENCYACTTFLNPALANVGGLVGSSGGSIVRSYWDTDISEKINSGGSGGTGLTTLEMKDSLSYVDWDFDVIWGINPTINEGYPYLKIFTVEPPPSVDVSLTTPLLSANASIDNPFMLITPNVTIQANEGFIRVVW